MQIKEVLIAKALIKDDKNNVIRRYVYFLDKQLREKIFGNEGRV